jgi:hypothetical protein
MAMYDVTKIGKFTLSVGAHEEGDHRRCLMEAAIIAAGFKHRKVVEVRDCPPCFSGVFAAYAMMLNDSMPNYLRDELLLPFVLRLADADTAANGIVESERLKFIVVEFMRRVNGYIFEWLAPIDYGMEGEKFLKNLVHLGIVVRNENGPMRVMKHMFTPVHLWVKRAIPRHQRKIFRRATDILDEALKINTCGGPDLVERWGLSRLVAA